MTTRDNTTPGSPRVREYVGERVGCQLLQEVLGGISVSSVHAHCWSAAPWGDGRLDRRHPAPGRGSGAVGLGRPWARHEAPRAGGGPDRCGHDSRAGDPLPAGGERLPAARRHRGRRRGRRAGVRGDLRGRQRGSAHHRSGGGRGGGASGRAVCGRRPDRRAGPAGRCHPAVSVRPRRWGGRGAVCAHRLGGGRARRRCGCRLGVEDVLCGLDQGDQRAAAGNPRGRGCARGG